MYYKTLKDFAQIISGHSFRAAIVPDNNGNTYVFQAKDVIQGQPFTNPVTLTKITYDNPGEKSFLRRNDVVVVARGTKFRATIFHSDVSNVIASASIHIVRTSSGEVDPEYVSHYLNSSIGQADLANKVTGNYIGALPIKGLGAIKIKLPPLAQQKLIVDLHRNVAAQAKIMDHKKTIEEAIINNIFRSTNAI